MGKRWSASMVLALCAVAFLFVGQAWAGDEGVRELEKKISKLQKVLDKAKKEGNWEKFVKVQNELAELYARLKKMHAGDGERKGKEDPELEEWVENLERRLRNLDSDGRIEALKRLIPELKERGEHGRAKKAMGILEAISKKRGAGNYEAELNKIERRMAELRREAGKAERDFDFERVDKIKKEMKKLEEHRKKIEKKGRKKDRKPGKMDEAEKDEQLRRLFKAFKEAKEAGNKKRMAELQRRIHEIKRGGKKPRKDVREWRGEALAILEEMMGRMRKWAKEAGRGGDEELAEHLEEGIAGLKNLWEGIERARGEDEVANVAEALEKAVKEIKRDIGRMQEEGSPKLVEYAKWAAENLWRVREVVGRARGTGRELAPFRREALGVMEQVVERFRDWAEHARESGAEERLRDMEKGLLNIKRFHLLLKEGGDEEVLEKALPALEEGIHKMKNDLRGAKEDGNEAKAEMLGWLVDRMHRVHDILAQGRRREGPERPGSARGGHEKAIEVVADVLEHLRKWVHEAKEEGLEEAVDEMTGGLHQMKELLIALKEARGPEQMEEIREALEEGIRDLRREVGRARSREEPEKVEKAGWVLERLQEVREMLQQRAPGFGRGFGRGGWGEGRMAERAEQAKKQIEELMKKAELLEREGRIEQAKALRFRAEAMEKNLRAYAQREEGQEGWGRRRDPDQKRNEIGKEMRRLMMELRRAQQKGDEDKVEELRRRMADLGERMGPREREPRQREPEAEGRRAKKETQKLREEIEEMRKELKDLKKLLMRLLEENKKD